MGGGPRGAGSGEAAGVLVGTLVPSRAYVYGGASQSRRRCCCCVTAASKQQRLSFSHDLKNVCKSVCLNTTPRSRGRGLCLSKKAAWRVRFYGLSISRRYRVRPAHCLLGTHTTSLYMSNPSSHDPQWLWCVRPSRTFRAPLSHTPPFAGKRANRAAGQTHTANSSQGVEGPRYYGGRAQHGRDTGQQGRDGGR